MKMLSISDRDKLISLTKEISHLSIKICNLFSAENQYILKHLAASQIHLALFMKDLAAISLGEEINIDEALLKTFLKECDCNIPNCS